MSKADNLENSQEIPASLKEAADEVSAVCKKAHQDAQDYPNLQAKLENHGLHAYRYEELSDGSCVALWANDADGTVKIKAFPSLAEASQWSPRSER